MGDRSRFRLLVVILIGVALAAASCVGVFLYVAASAQQRRWLPDSGPVAGAEMHGPLLTAVISGSAGAVLVIAFGIFLLRMAMRDPSRRLRENEEMQRELSDNSPMPLCIIDPESKTALRANAAMLSLLGYSADELARLPITALEPKLSAGEASQRLARILQSEGAEFETTWRTKTGALRTVAVSARPRCLGGRAVVHLVATDLTDRLRSERRIRELQEQLQRATRANELGQVASTLAHELAQPLTAALNYVRTSVRVLQGGDDAAREQATELATKGIEQINRASTVIRNLRDYIRPRVPTYASIDVNALIGETVEMVASTTASEGIDIRLRLAEGLPPVRSDRLQLQQVLANLLRNAFEALSGREVGSVVVESVRVGAQWVEVGVSDDGPGIPAEISDRLFLPFVTTKPDGLGIGLAISRVMMEMHGGRIWAERGGNGAVFRLALPVDPSHRAEAVSADADD